MNLNNILSDTNLNPHSIFECKVGNSTSVSFWNETWISDSNTKALFPRLFSLETLKDFSSSDVCNLLKKPKIRTWGWRRRIRGRAKEAQLNNLISILQDFDPSPLLVV
ncbi:hypothetical protein CTI12_AA066360 [Artemisia annua]|uniref:RNA-directed DNA polymerase, eukaryota, Reverse transcriptase zinc-binding domain protein n=1 Tax=Artemisia annua TaxID=35608 RepID=A0A2U1Q7E5_ARTAN|nr:hypothetical protein CTI12_AA066360 [Artemisia annua]